MTEDTDRRHEFVLDERGANEDTRYTSRPADAGRDVTAGHEQAAKMRMEERVTELEHRVRELEMKLEQMEEE